MDRHLKALWGITAISAGLRLCTLSVERLWYDETFTAWLAGLSWPALLDATAGDVHPPTWYMIEKLMVLLLGNSEVSLRLVSALAGVALVPVIYFIAIRFDFEPTDALWAAGLAAVAPNTVYFSQEARPYSLILLCAALGLLALLQRRHAWLLLAALGMLYLHNLAVFGVATLGWLAVYRRDYRSVAALLLAGLLWLPWLWFGLWPQIDDVRDGFWVRPPTYGTPAYVIYSLLFSTHGAALVLAGAPLLAIGLWQGWPLLPRSARPVLPALILLPISGLVIASLLISPVLIPRVVIFAVVPLYLWFSLALRRNKPLLLATATVFVAYFALYWGLPQFGRYSTYGLNDLYSQWRPGDAIYHANVGTYISFAYYLPDTPQYVWPQANDLSQSLTPRTKQAMGMRQAKFEEISCNHNRFWLAFYENPTTGPQERHEIERLRAAYGARFISTILSGQMYRARLYRIDNPCAVVSK